MDEEEKILIIDQFLELLGKKKSGTIPGLIDEHPIQRISQEKDLKYRIVESELERLGLVYFIRGKIILLLMDLPSIVLHHRELNC